MICGLGIDITEITRIKEMVSQHPSLPERILAIGEQEQLSTLHRQRYFEYLAGRWSLKEAFAKAMGTGIGKKVGFQDIEIVDNSLGAPIVTKSPFEGAVHVSVSHTNDLVMTEVILEK